MSDQPRRAVVADAEPDTLQIVSRAVEEAGYEVITATGNGPDTIAVVTEFRPDLLVLDVDLPYLSGLDALTEIKAASPETEVLILTRDESLHDRATGSGAFGVVYKTRLTELAGALGRVTAFLDSDRSPGERRTGSDRRQAQDWNKVTSERRQGDRREP
jgi:two-component system OmpR family response regulator